MVEMARRGKKGQIIVAMDNCANLLKQKIYIF